MKEDIKIWACPFKSKTEAEHIQRMDIKSANILVEVCWTSGIASMLSKKKVTVHASM